MEILKRIKRFFCKHPSRRWKYLKIEGVVSTYDIYCQHCEKLVMKNINQIDYERYVELFKKAMEKAGE